LALSCSVPPPMLAASRRDAGEGERASSAKAMGIECAEATDVPTCWARHSRDDDAGLTDSCMALRVAAMTPGSGVHAPRAGSAGSGGDAGVAAKVDGAGQKSAGELVDDGASIQIILEPRMIEKNSVRSLVR